MSIRLATLEHVVPQQRTTVLPAHVCYQVRRSAAEHTRDIDAAAACDVRATACACRSKSQHVAPSDRERTPWWRGLVIESSCEIAARHRNCDIVPELERRSDYRALERCAIRRITNEQVCDPVRDRIHGTGGDYTVLLHTAATGVLDGRQQARSPDVDHGLP